MSKKEKKLREEEHLKILKNITSKNSIQVPLEPLQKAKQYSNMISELEKCVKYFPDSDKKEKKKKKYVSKIEELSEEASEIYFSNNKYEECIDLSKNLLKYNNKNDKAIFRSISSFIKYFPDLNKYQENYKEININNKEKLYYIPLGR